MDKVVHFEIPVDDVARAKEFYGSIFGRELQDMDMDGTITIDVASIDDALKQIESAGGSSVQTKTEIPGMGAFAYFKDPEGNVVGLWQNAG